jgi:hypothetical protein
MTSIAPGSEEIVMSTLLHISSSPRGTASESLAVAEVFLDSAVYGPDYRPGFGRDYQQTFFDDWLDWAGITDRTALAFRPNLVTTDADTTRRQAHAAARELGKRF